MPIQRAEAEIGSVAAMSILPNGRLASKLGPDLLESPPRTYNKKAAKNKNKPKDN